MSQNFKNLKSLDKEIIRTTTHNSAEHAYIHRTDWARVEGRPVEAYAQVISQA